MSYLVISTSLNPDSKSFVLAREAYTRLSQLGDGPVELIDLRKVRLPHCDGDKSFSHRNVKKLAAKIAAAKCIILAVPIYNYDVGSVVKNLIELTNDAWQEKTVGFVSAAGGKSGNLATMGIASSLMLDFRCLIIPRFCSADRYSFDANSVLIDPRIDNRLNDLVDMAKQLKGVAISGKLSPRAAAMAAMQAAFEKDAAAKAAAAQGSSQAPASAAPVASSEPAPTSDSSEAAPSADASVAAQTPASKS